MEKIKQNAVGFIVGITLGATGGATITPAEAPAPDVATTTIEHVFVFQE